VLFILNLTFAGIAQDPPYNVFTEDNGLPSNEVFGLALTADNVLWANTDRGVVSYDGYRFTTYTQSEGLLDNCILRLFCDSQDQIWMCSVVNTVNRLIDGKVDTPNLSNDILELPSHEHFVQQLFFHPNGNSYINFNSPGLFEFDSSPFTRVEDHLQLAGENTFYIYYASPEAYYWDQLLKSPERKEVDAILTHQNGNDYYIKAHNEIPNQHYRKQLAPVGHNEFFFAYCDQVMHFKEGALIKQKRMPNEVLSLTYDSNLKDLWVGVQLNGIRRYENHDLDSKPRIFHEGLSVSALVIDHEGSYWFATTQDGVYQAHTMHVQNFLPSDSTKGGRRDDIITSMTAIKGALYYGTQSGKLFKKIPGDDYESKPFDIELKLEDAEGQVRKIFETSLGSLVIFSDDYHEIWPDGKKTGRGKWDVYAYDFIELNNQHRILSFTNNIQEEFDGSVIIDYRDDPYFQKVRNILLDSDSTLWLSSQPYGVYEWPKDKARPISCLKIDSIFENRALGLCQTGDYIWFSISGKGLVGLSKTTRELIHLTKNSHKLSSDILDVLYPENDTCLWVGSNAGMDQITFDPNFKSPPIIKNFTTRLGLPSNKIQCITKFEGSIWVGTNRGLVRLMPQVFDEPPSNTIILKLLSAKADTLALNLSESPVLDAGLYDMQFSIRAVSFQTPHEVYYQYRLLPLGNNWLESEERLINFPQLSYGEYELEVRASYTANFENYSKISYSFTIEKKFYQTVLFLLLMITVGLVLSAAVVWLIIMGLKTREKNKQRLLQAEKKALLSQMNPHFIFNSLNSIQHYIIQQDEENANMYLSKFSSLIRRILDNSKKRMISLTEEIDTLELYLNLEKLRFEDKFSFTIEKSDNLEQNEVMIPPMLIQPYVENAIWHGLTPLENGGLLTISFSRFNQNMRVCIEDNGIGRTKSARTRSRPPGYTSTGLSNIEERLLLLNKMSKQSIRSEIIDMILPDGTSGGTRVELSIPLNLDLKQTD